MTGKLTLSILAAATLTFGAAAKEVKLLTIGNSFADSAFKFLPKVAESAGDKVIMDRANIGGRPPGAAARRAGGEQHGRRVDCL